MTADDEATPSEFPFPFEPWPIQRRFMRSLYDTIEDRKVGVFESPTGTGKSLSIICGAFRWLRVKQSASIEDLIRSEEAFEEESAAARQNETSGPSSTTDNNEPEWIREFQRQRRRTDIANRLERKRRAREAREARLAHLRSLPLSDMGRFKRKAETRIADELKEPKESLIVDDYSSDGDADRSTSTKHKKHAKILIDDLDNDDDDGLNANDNIDDEDDGPGHPQIIYSARTHSQISQFVNEIKKTVYADAKCITLGSRKNMCINQSVQKLQSNTRINDRCIELHRGGKDSETGCTYHQDENKQMPLFADFANAQIRDIEELVQIGQKNATCPYYGARFAIRSSEVICVPYNLLLQKSARESIGLKLKGNVVILDEAHNIIETVKSLHSHSITLEQTRSCARHLTSYFERYKSRLAGRNIIYIKQLLLILSCLDKFFCDRNGSGNVTDTATGQNCDASAAKMDNREPQPAFSVSEFVDRLGIDHINLFKIQKYIEISGLKQKLLGFALQEVKHATKTATASGQTGKEPYVSASVSPLAILEPLIASLACADVQGRVLHVHHSDPSQSAVKYLLLNPADCFASILEETRAVVFAGGTMAPTKDFIDQLLPSIPSTKLSLFTCSHIIPSTSLLPMCISRGPSELELDFSHKMRHKHNMMDEAGLAIANYASILPGGLVVFFVSYSYLEAVCARWKTTKVWDRISKKKKIFIEPTSVAAVDRVLHDYGEAVKPKPTDGTTTTTSMQTGAILLAVVSGKLSEGINFADDMGRAVAMIGIPFANIMSAELREKMRFFDAQSKSNGYGLTGSEYYENLCMRAVNQSIGRVIRHKDDYAAILLLDHRYQQDRIIKKLPEWIRDCHVRSFNAFGPSVATLSSFFASKRLTR